VIVIAVISIYTLMLRDDDDDHGDNYFDGDDDDDIDHVYSIDNAITVLTVK